MVVKQGPSPHHTHEQDEEWTCNRCGWKLIPVQSFLDTFGEPGGGGAGGPMPAIRDESGTIYPLVGKNLSHARLYDLGESVERWADPGDDLYIEDIRREAQTSSKHRICSWCYKLYGMPGERGVQ